jgi:hypothetical protein
MFRCLWRVPIEGFQWVLAQPVIPHQPAAEPVRVLAPVGAPQWRRYDPLRDEPALFRTFGEVAPTEADIQVFASRYGALGLDEPVILPDGKGARGERLDTWRTELATMHHALRVWEALKAGAHEDLARWFHRTDHGSFSTIEYHPDEPWPRGVLQQGVQVVSDELADLVWFLQGRARHDLVASPEATEPRGWALATLRGWVDVRVGRYTGLRVHYGAADARAVPLALVVVPQHLLGALWVQLALAIERNPRYERCHQCRTWFPVPPKANRPNTRFCSTRCRMQAYRATHPLEHRQPAALRGP